MLYTTKYPCRMFTAWAKLNYRGEDDIAGVMGILPGVLCFDSMTKTLVKPAFDLAVECRDRGGGERTYCIVYAHEAFLHAVMRGLSDVASALAKLDPVSGVSVELMVLDSLRIAARKVEVSVPAGFLKSRELALDEYQLTFEGRGVFGSLDSLRSLDGIYRAVVKFTTDAGPPLAIFETILAEWDRSREEATTRVRSYFGSDGIPSD